MNPIPDSAESSLSHFIRPFNRCRIIEGPFDVTLDVNFTVWPTRDGLPELVTFVIVANGLFTTWLSACEVLDRFMLVISFGDRLKRAVGFSVDSADSKQVTDLLLQWGRGDRKALEAVLPIVYAELRRKARYHLQKQRPNHTLQSAALVHEVYLRLADEQALQAENRAHFVGIAAQLMRWILVDYERNRLASKRGGGLTRPCISASKVARR